MGAYSLIGAGALFAVLFALNNLIKTILRREKVSFIDVLLTFLTVVLLLVGLVIANAPDPASTSPTALADARIARGVLLIGGALAVFSLIILVAELFRPQRLKGSRGVLGIYSGVLLVIASFAVPFAGAYIAVQEQIAVATPVPPTAVAQAVDSAVDPAATTEPTAGLGTATLTSDQQERTTQLFKAITSAVTDEIDVDPETITDALQNGKPLAQIIEEHGGSVDHVVAAITEIMDAGVRDAAARGEINALQAALALSQMENFIRLAVNSDLYALSSQLGGATPDPNATRPNLFAFATESPEATAGATAETTAEVMMTATDTRPPKQPSATPTFTPAPTNTSLPTPTPTASATRYHYSTRTPTPTFTPVTPCLASVEYNLRLRSAPNTDSDTLTVIDYGTTVELYGKGGASENGALWWYTVYEGQEGWLDGQYMLVGSGCDRLPQR